MLSIKKGMKEFFIYLTAYKEESEGQLKELRAFADDHNVPFLRRDELPESETMETSTNSANVGEGIIYIDKEHNDDLIKAVRLALTFDADGVVIPFGNNDKRDYIKNNLAFSSKEAKKAVEEITRLAPLFGRIIKK